LTLFDLILQFVLSGLSVGSTYALIAIGFNMVYNATGIVNFAQTIFIMLGGMLGITFYSFLNLPMALSVLLSVTSVTLIGALIERGIIRISKSQQAVILIFITIGVSVSIEGTALLFWGPFPLALSHFSGDRPLSIFGAVILPQNLWIYTITFIIVIVLHFFLKRTITGKAMRATAINKKGAYLVGIDVRRMAMLSFALSGGLGAMAGVIIAPITTSSYDVGTIIGLKGFASAILGGYGNMIGAVVGGLLLGVLESLGAGLISSTYKDAIAFLILLMVLFFKPTGILGRGEVENIQEETI
jgi:branched-chain amino acid transport system permease protein